MTEKNITGWANARVGEIADLLRGITYQKEQASNTQITGYKPVLRANNINGSLNFDDLVYVPEQNINEQQLLRAGDIVFAMSSGSKHLVGKSAQAKSDFDGSYGAFCAALRTNKLVSKDYVYYVFQGNNFRRLISEIAKGSNINNLKREHILDFEIYLPPIAEQHRIVAKIEELFSELDKGIENLKTAREQLKVYRQALLKHAFEGKLTREWREQNRDQLETAAALLARTQTEREQRYQQQLKQWQTTGGSKPKAPKTLPPLTAEELTALPELPEGWGWQKLGEFIEAIEAGKSFKCDEREPSANEIGVAKVSAVTWGEYDESESKTCIDAAKENDAYLILSGDFILSRANTIDLVGACVIARKVTKKIMLSDKTLRIKFNGFSQEYFLQFLRSRFGRKQIMLLSTGNQESMRNIGQDRIRSIVVPVCSNEEAEAVMEALASKLSEVDQLDQTITASLQQSEALRQSILKKAFAGILVAQDDRDEPAAVLLARIQTEREQHDKPKRGRKAS